jgi:hypothetical protein
MIEGNKAGKEQYAANDSCTYRDDEFQKKLPPGKKILAVL